MQKSHLHDVTQASGALTGEWQGWELPLSYGNPEEEYSSATTSAAVYDASATRQAQGHGEPTGWTCCTVSPPTPWKA